MQDIHSIGGGGGAAGTLFGGGGGGGGGGGDRRLRLTNHHNFSHLHHPHHHNQVLKCPRCDSLNTKFCYYNNYNLSQPRHFCKSCRRYWTKGGVLRNVPVGGGCRKSKRSSKPRSSTTTTTSSISATISPPPPSQLTQPTSNSHSSSESSSLTAGTNMNTNTNTSTAVEAVSGYSSSLNGVVGGHLGPTGLGFEPNECGIFPDMGSSFTSLMTTSAHETSVPFGFSNLLNPSHHHQEQRQLWNQEDQTAEVVGMQKGSGGFGALDWQASGEGVGDQGFFDLPVISGVDQGYWGQSQWTTDQDHDHSNLYLP